MKKLFTFLLILLLIPVTVMGEVCDTDKITISSINIESISDGAEEKTAASASGKNVNLDLGMSEVGDNVKYKIVVKNDSDDDYEIDEGNFNISNNYIKYTLESDTESNIVPGKSTKIMYLKVQYDKEVPSESFDENGSYKENQSMVVNLSNDKEDVTPTPSASTPTPTPEQVKVPDTKSTSMLALFSVLIIIAGIAIGFIAYDKYDLLLVLLVASFILIPISANALCKCNINIDSKVEITTSNMKEFCVRIGEEIARYNYEEGMTFNDFLNSEYNTKPFYRAYEEISIEENGNCSSLIFHDSDDYVEVNHTIKPCTEDTYYLTHPVC